MIGDENEAGKLTEFDSSFATLRRIDNLIVHLHNAALGLLPDKDNDEQYIKTLFRLYCEADNKMKDEELVDAKKFIEQLDKAQVNSCPPTIRRGYSIQYANPLYYKGKREVMVIARDFEIFLMRTMEKHNMLLRNAKDGISRFRGL